MWMVGLRAVIGRVDFFPGVRFVLGGLGIVESMGFFVGNMSEFWG